MSRYHGTARCTEAQQQVECGAAGSLLHLLTKLAITVQHDVTSLMWNHRLGLGPTALQMCTAEC